MRCSMTEPQLFTVINNQSLEWTARLTGTERVTDDVDVCTHSRVGDDWVSLDTLSTLLLQPIICKLCDLLPIYIRCRHYLLPVL